MNFIVDLLYDENNGSVEKELAHYAWDELENFSEKVKSSREENYFTKAKVHRFGKIRNFQWMVIWRWK